MEKRGQLTLFIVMGLVVLILAGLWLYLPMNNIKETTISSQEFEARAMNARTMHSYCMEERLRDVLSLMGKEGGSTVIMMDSDSLTLLMEDWFQEGKDTSPSIEALQKVISNELEDLAGHCAANISDGVIISEEAGKPVLKASIVTDQVIVTGMAPIKITHGSFSKIIREFGIAVPIRLGHIYRIAKDIVRMEQEDSKYLDYNALMDYDVDITIQPKNGHRLITITDHSSIIKTGVPYEFSFGNLMVKQ